jgi:hypothetical protein
MLGGEMWVNPAYEQHIAFDNLIAAGRIGQVRTAGEFAH